MNVLHTAIYGVVCTFSVYMTYPAMNGFRHVISEVLCAICQSGGGNKWDTVQLSDSRTIWKRVTQYIPAVRAGGVKERLVGGGGGGRGEGQKFFLHYSLSPLPRLQLSSARRTISAVV